MLKNMNLGAWDLLLLVVVSFQAVMIAYVSQPKWKAFIITLPFPFSISVLAVGQEVDATNILGLLLLLLFAHGVRIFYVKLHVPIVIAIFLSGLGYCVLGTTCASLLPQSKWIFWLAGTAIITLAVLILARHSYRNEPNYRSPLPIWKKLPIVMIVVVLLILIKSNLRGFMTVFPMVGVVGVYEARHSLGSMCRQIPVIILTIGPMMIFIRLAQGSLGLGESLLLSWLVFIVILLPLTVYMWKKLPIDSANTVGGTPSIETP